MDSVWHVCVCVCVVCVCVHKMIVEFASDALCSVG